MKYYIDSQGYLVSLTYVDGTTEIDAPELDCPLSQYQWVDGAWILSDQTPQRVLDSIAEETRQFAIKEALKKRLDLLSASDWTDTASAPARMGDLYQQWQTYRQSLRDITKQPGYPLNIIWAVPPI